MVPFSMSVMGPAVGRSDDDEEMMIGGIGDPWIGTRNHHFVCVLQTFNPFEVRFP